MDFSKLYQGKLDSIVVIHRTGWTKEKFRKIAVYLLVVNTSKKKQNKCEFALLFLVAFLEKKKFTPKKI